MTQAECETQQRHPPPNPLALLPHNFIRDLTLICDENQDEAEHGEPGGQRFDSPY